mmetsp:Transcript_57784/g.154760  ORF Transcript_57784/g.154760 Transcript_57784/m.154760 type:complete len:235 (+) Transcript_57784:1330-2034(+)
MAVAGEAPPLVGVGALRHLQLGVDALACLLALQHALLRQLVELVRAPLTLPARPLPRDRGDAVFGGHAGRHAVSGERVHDKTLRGDGPMLVLRVVRSWHLARVGNDILLVLCLHSAPDVHAEVVALIPQEGAVLHVVIVEGRELRGCALLPLDEAVVFVAIIALLEPLVGARCEELSLRTAQGVANDVDLRARGELREDGLPVVDALDHGHELELEAPVHVSKAAEALHQGIHV